MYFVYSALLALAFLLTFPYWLVQALLHGKHWRALPQRLGSVPAHLNGRAGSIWIHAVSVGEVLAVAALVEALRREFPQVRVVVSTTTDTGHKLARERFGEDRVFYFPLDFAFAIRPYLRALKPELIILAETEFWPNFLRLAHAAGARIAVVNARISDRSLPGYRRMKPLLRGVLNNIDLFLAQTDEDRRRLAEIGAIEERITVSGNLKFDAPAPPTIPLVSELRSAIALGKAGPVLVCGSTVADEESLLLDAFQVLRQAHPGALMILAPRKPERFAAVAALLEQQGIPFLRRSSWSGEPVSGGVFLLDSIGELASLYILGDIAFVGGSLVPRGGHNILEPAQFGVPILVGPHTENFRDIVGLFARRRGVRAVQASELAPALTELLANDPERVALGRRGAEVLKAHAGANQRTLAALARLLQSGSSPQEATQAFSR